MAFIGWHKNPSLGDAIATGLQTGMQNEYEQQPIRAKQQKEASALQQLFASEDFTKDPAKAIQSVMANPNLDMEAKKSIFSGLEMMMKGQSEAQGNAMLQQMIGGGGAAPPGAPMGQGAVDSQAGPVTQQGMPSPQQGMNPPPKAPANTPWYKRATRDELRRAAAGAPNTPAGKQIKTLVSGELAERKIGEDQGYKQQDIDIKRENLNLKKTKQEAEMEAAETKDAKEWQKGLTERYQSILENKPVQQLLQKGAKDRGFASGLRTYVMKHYDLPAGMLLNPTEEVIEKLTQQTVRGVSKYYSGRILQSEIENQIRSNPSMLNSVEGQERLAKTNLELDSIVEEEYKIAKHIVEENNGKVPKDLAIQVLEQTTPYAEAVMERAARIMKGEDKIIPEAKPGEKITRQQQDYLINKHKGNKVAAMEEARNLGYE